MVLKRILTRKSKFGIGKIKDCTVQDLLDRKKHFELISAYFKLTTIDFTKDILDELLITGEYIIIKPNSNKDIYKKFCFEMYGRKQKVNNRSKRLMGKEQRISKSQLRANNQKK